MTVHGRSGYTNRGCRCDVCREAQRTYMLHVAVPRMRARLAETGLPGRHGTVSTYRNYGCRCEDCTAAHAAACARYKAKREALR